MAFTALQELLGVKQVEKTAQPLTETKGDLIDDLIQINIAAAKKEQNNPEKRRMVRQLLKDLANHADPEKIRGEVEALKAEYGIVSDPDGEEARPTPENPGATIQAPVRDFMDELLDLNLEIQKLDHDTRLALRTELKKILRVVGDYPDKDVRQMIDDVKAKLNVGGSSEE